MNGRGRDGDDAGERPSQKAQELRKRAEAAALEKWTDDPASLPVEETRRLLHELRVHQIELELQNEELRRAQVALDAARARYFDLYDLAPVGYVTLDENGLIQEANLRASGMLGTPRAELVDQPLTRFIAADDQDIYYRHRKKLRETSEPQVCELRMKQHEDTQLWVRLLAVSDRDQDSGAPIFRVTLSDITEQRALHASLAHADHMASMGILAAGVAHEINNPLTYVLYNIESLADELPLLEQVARRYRAALREQAGEDALAEIAGEGAAMLDPRALADMSERARQAIEGARRIRDITRGLGLFARVEKDELAVVDLNRAVQHAIDLAVNEIKCRAVMVKDFGPLPMVLASDGKLAQVFLNLIVNAAHAIEEGAVEDNRIEVHTWAAGDHVFAAVSDTGCGIAEQDLDSIFEPFFTTKGPDRGTGLGLAIARRIVTELGGDIQVESTVGKGTRFVLRFPAKQARTQTAPAKQAAVPNAKGRILVVDDEELVRTTLEKILGKQHEVVAIGSGRETMELLGTDSRFDLVLCDLMMPEVTGIELHAWLVEHHPELSRRLVFITGGVFTPKTNEYLGRHPDIIRFNKPFDTDELRRLIGEYIAAVGDE